MEQRVLSADEDYCEVTRYIQENGISRTMIVCDGSLEHLRIWRYFQRIGGKIGISLMYFSDFKPNPLYESVVQGVEQFQRNRCDSIIAVGGGSAIDVAKCVKLYSNMNLDRNFLRQEIVPNDIKLLAIPTTAGTGSESTRFAVIYYNGEKQSVTHESCIPDGYMLDASVLKTLPDYQKKSAALDALCHGIESFWSVNSTEESRKYSSEAVKIICETLDSYLANDEKYNGSMLYAANLAGKAINIAQTTAGHAMCYKMTSLYGITHGHAAALCIRKLWPFMIKNMDKCIDPRGREHLSKIFSEIADAMDCATAIDAAKKFQDMFNDMRLRKPMWEEKDIEVLSESVNPVRLKNNPVHLTADIIEGLYRQILREEV